MAVSYTHLGTMAHAWVQMFDTEYEAFEAYCKMYPHAATLLVDTYDTVSSGIPNAIKAFKNVLLPMGITDCGIRLDSGDIAYLSKKARKMLDDAGLYDCKIVASNSLDEYIIKDIICLLYTSRSVQRQNYCFRYCGNSSLRIFSVCFKHIRVYVRQQVCRRNCRTVRRKAARA